MIKIGDIEVRRIEEIIIYEPMSLFAVWHWPRWVWAVVAVLLLIAYPLSFGPALWLMVHGYIPAEFAGPISYVYAPVFAVAELSGQVDLLEWYLDLWTPEL